MDIKKLSEEVLANNADASSVFITECGMPFLKENDARNYAKLEGCKYEEFKIEEKIEKPLKKK